MKRFLSFILGLIFGIVFLLGTFGLAMYTSVTTVHPNEIYADLEKYLGDLGDVSLLQAYYNILKLYNDNTGGLTNGDLYSVGDFLADNHISTTNEETGEVTAFGIVMPEALLDAPLFEYFNNNVDENGHTGVQRALKQIKLSAVPSVVNMFTPAEGEKFISDEVTTELDNYSVFDLVYGENTAEGEAPNIVANLATITKNIKLVHLIPSLHTEEETENLIKTVLSAVGEASIGELITDLTSNNNIFGMLNADGSLREVGKLTFADILGENDPLISSMLGSISISDFIADNGNINITQALDKVSISGLFGLIKRPAEAEGATVVHYYKTAEEGAETYVWSVGEKDGKYYISTDANKEGSTPTWYEGQLCCKNEAHVAFENHTKDCFKYVLYQKCTNESGEHDHAEDAFTKTEEQVDGSTITIGYVKASDLYNTLGNMTVGSIMEGGISSVFEDIKDMKLGELLEMFGINSDSTGIMNTLKNLTINDLMSGGYKSLQLGEILGYVHYENTNTIDVDSKKEHVDGENVVGYTATIGGQLVLSTNGSTWYNAKLTCKETHEHTFDCYGKVWYQECGEIHNHNENDAFSKTKEGVEIWYAEVVGLYDTLADMTIGSIMDGGFSSLFNDIKDIKLGELLKTFGMDGEMTGIMSAINDLTLNELMSGGYNSLLLGEILSYERNANDGVRTGEVTFDDDEGNVIGYVAMVGSQIVISADGTTWYNGKLACKTEPHNHVESCGTEGAYTCGKEAHQHTFGCYGYVWYQECTNKDPDHDHSGEFKKTKEQDGLTVDVWYVEATGMYNALAGLTIGDLTAGGDVMNTLLDKLTLGDVMKNGMPSMLESLKDTPISQLNGAIKTVKVGDYVGFKRSEVDVADWTLVETDVYQKDDTFAKKEGDKHYLAELTCEDATHVHTVDCYTCIWYAKDGVTPLSGVEKALADKVIDDLSDFKTILNDLTLGEVLSPVPDILKSIADTPINKLNTAIEGLYVGELLGYKKDADVWYKECPESCGHGDSEHTNIDGKYYVETTGIEKVLAGKTINELKDLNSILNDVTLGDVMQDNLPDMLNSLKDVKIGELSTEITKTKVGNLLEFTYDEENSCWKKDDGTGVLVELTGIEKVLTDKSISELKNLNTILNDVTLGDVMQDNLPDMLESLADTPISGLNSALDGLYVGEMLKYTRTLTCTEDHDHTDDCYKWVNGDADVDGMMAKIANKKVGNLGSIGDDIQGYTIVDVLGKKDTDSALIKALYDTPVGEIGSAMDNIQLGTAMGYYRNPITCTITSEGHAHSDDCSYEKADGKFVWYKKCEESGCTHSHVTIDGNNCVKVGAPQSAFVNSTLSGIGDDISHVKLGELINIDDESSSMLQALKDTPIDGIGNAINTMALGTSMGFVRREIDTTTGYADIRTITTVKTNGTIIAKVLGDTWYEAVFNCKDTTHAHTANCYNYVWYEKCTANEHEHTAECGETEVGCTTTAHKHDMTIDETNYDKVGGLNAKMANLTVESMNSNAFVQIVEDLSMRDLIDSGVLTFSDEEKYKLAIMSGCGCTDCTLAKYIAYKTTPGSSIATAKDYFRSCHSTLSESKLAEHRDKWQDCTLNQFISALLKGI